MKPVCKSFQIHKICNVYVLCWDSKLKKNHQTKLPPVSIQPETSAILVWRLVLWTRFNFSNTSWGKFKLSFVGVPIACWTFRLDSAMKYSSFYRYLFKFIWWTRYCDHAWKPSSDNLTFFSGNQAERETSRMYKHSFVFSMYIYVFFLKMMKKILGTEHGNMRHSGV